MHEIDAQLIAALRQNARASVSELATRLSVSRTTVRNRIARLVAERKILGFTVVLEGDASEQPVRGVTMIGIEGTSHEAIAGVLAGFSEVRTIHTMNGRWDRVVAFAVPTLEALDRFLKRLRAIDGVAGSETGLYLSTVRSSGERWRDRRRIDASIADEKDGPYREIEQVIPSQY